MSSGILLGRLILPVHYAEFPLPHVQQVANVEELLLTMEARLSQWPSRLLKNPVVSCSDSSSEEIWKNKDESRGPYAKSTERQNSPVKVSNKGLK